MASPVNNPTELSSHDKENYKSNNEGYLWLGSRGSKGLNYLYPCDLIPFTRKLLFLVVDSNSRHAIKAIHERRNERQQPCFFLQALAPSMVASTDSTRYQHGSHFTMFLVALIQAFCFFIGMFGMNLDKDTYDKAEKLLSLSLIEWEAALMASDSVHPVWVEVLGDPLLRRLILRFGNWLTFGCAELGQFLVCEWRLESYTLKQQGRYFFNLNCVSCSLEL